MQELCVKEKSKLPDGKKTYRCNTKKHVMKRLAKRLCEHSEPVDEVCKEFTIDKETYKLWEARVCKLFYTDDKKKTSLIPCYGEKSLLSKEKYILVVDTCSDTVKGLKVGDSGIDNLPKGTGFDMNIELFHAGKQTKDGVKMGPDEDKYKHPAFDAGGLTNYKQKFEENIDGIGQTFSPTATTGEILEAWKRLGGKTWTAKNLKTLEKNLDKFVVSLKELTPTLPPFRLHLVKMPAEHRVVVTARDVKKATGQFFTRAFNREYHGRASDVLGLYVGVASEFITPNLNKKNLTMEYKTY
jgi:hypothetical protein